MNLKTKTYNLFVISEVVDKLVAQQLEYSVGVAYKIYLLSNKLNDTQKYVLSRLHAVFGDDFRIDNLTPQQEEIYGAVMDSDIELVDLPDLTIEEVISSADVKLSVSDMAILQIVLKKVE